MKIYKYQLHGHMNELEIPYEKIINVINQDGVPTLYCLVDDNKEVKKIKVCVIGTGWDIPEEMIEDNIYLNTITDGMFVWHIFYKEQTKYRF